MKVLTHPLRGRAHQVVTAAAVGWAGFVTLGALAGFVPDAPGPEAAGAKVTAADPGAATAAVNAVRWWLVESYPTSEPPAVMPITVRPDGAQWIATVQVGNPYVEPACFAVRVRSDGTALLPPTPTECLPPYDELSISSILDDDSPELRAAAQFAEAWMTGGPIDRFLAPGFQPGVLPANRDITVRSVDKQDDRVVVALNIPVHEASPLVVAVSLGMEQINGQWMVNSVQPVQPQES